MRKLHIHLIPPNDTIYSQFLLPSLNLSSLHLTLDKVTALNLHAVAVNSSLLTDLSIIAPQLQHVIGAINFPHLETLFLSMPELPITTEMITPPQLTMQLVHLQGFKFSAYFSLHDIHADKLVMEDMTGPITRLQGYPQNLTTFILSNTLVHSYSDLKLHLVPTLQTLSITHTGLSYIYTNVLDYLPNLKHVNLSHNALTSFTLRPRQLPDLQILDLSDNRLTVLEQTLLLRPSLVAIHLQNNLINNIESMAADFSFITVDASLIDLSNNSLPCQCEMAIFLDYLTDS